MTKISARELQRGKRRPWQERRYVISKGNTRGSVLMAAGLEPSAQYCITLPPELARKHFVRGTVFQWIEDGELLLLVPTGDTVVRGTKASRTWTAEADALVLAKEYPDREIASQLGVTRQAVGHRRYFLRARDRHASQ